MNRSTSQERSLLRERRRANKALKICPTNNLAEFELLAQIMFGTIRHAELKTVFSSRYGKQKTTSSTGAAEVLREDCESGDGDRAFWGIHDFHELWYSVGCQLCGYLANDPIHTETQQQPSWVESVENNGETTLERDAETPQQLTEEPQRRRCLQPTQHNPLCSCADLWTQRRRTKDIRPHSGKEGK